MYGISLLRESVCGCRRLFQLCSASIMPLLLRSEAEHEQESVGVVSAKSSWRVAMTHLRIFLLNLFINECLFGLLLVVGDGR